VKGDCEVTRTLRIEWAAGQKVTGRLSMPAGRNEAETGVLLAHGAGAGQEHPFIVRVRNGLAAAGYPTLSFNYAYSEAGRRAPDRLPKLLAVHEEAADRLARYCGRVVFAGKSMGGRVGSHLAGDVGWPAAALVYLGYPLVPVGKGDPRPVDHLHQIAVPQLFVAGTRDRLSPPGLIEPLAASLPDARVIVVPDGDHSLEVPKRSGRTSEEVLGGIIAEVAASLLRFRRG
jgi:predicted alpha/beta-hydrolase family hydrolase